MKGLKLHIFILFILMALSACALPNPAPVEDTEATATPVVNTPLSTKPRLAGGCRARELPTV